MTNLDRVLKRRDVTFLTNVHIVKATAFPVVMYGWESWTIKKAECWRVVVLEKTLESLLDYKEIKINQFQRKPTLNTHRKDCWESSKVLATWCKESKGKRQRGWQRIRWLDGITDSTDSLSELQEMVEDRGGWHAAVHQVTESQTWLKRLNNKNGG